VVQSVGLDSRAWLDEWGMPFTDEKGAVVNWSVEMSSPGVLTRAGWNRRMFVAGDAVSIVVNPSRAGTPVGVCLNPCTVTANGKALSAREP